MRLQMATLPKYALHGLFAALGPVIPVAAVALTLLAVAGFATAAPLAGSTISNQATVTYLDTVSGFHATMKSNTLNLIVQPLEALTLTQNQNVSRPAGGGFSLAHRLTNTGNTSSTYAVSYASVGGDYGAANLVLVRDINGNGLADKDEPVLGQGAQLSLGPGERADLVITGTVPGTIPLGKTARIELTAVSVLQGAGAANIDSITTANIASVQLNKSASSLAPGRGDSVTFTLSATNTGNAAAAGVPVTVDGVPTTLVVVRDPLPENTSFVSISGPAGGTALYHKAGDAPTAYISAPPSDLGQVDAAGYGFASVAAGQTVRVALRIGIHANAADSIVNTAQALFTDGTAPIAVDSNQVQLKLAPLPPTVRYYTDATFTTEAFIRTTGAPLHVQADAAACNTFKSTVETVVITITSALTGDSESFLATETAADSGQFRIGSSPITRDTGSGPGTAGNGILESRKGDALTATINGCGANAVQTTILIDPSGVVFDSKTGAPVAGATVTLIDVAGSGNGGRPGAPARVFLADGVTPAPSTVITGVDGRYEFPLVYSSIYRLAVVAAGFSFPSTLAPALLPPGRTINFPGSFGGDFAVNTATGAVTVDLPLDANAGGGIFVQKSASRTVAEIGEFVDYTVRIKNVSGAGLAGLTVFDTLPAGFAYQPGTARLDGRVVSDPAGGRGPALSFAVGALGEGVTAVLTYRVQIGPGATRGDGINRAQAMSAPPLQKTSNVATVRVKVEGGVFTEKAYIIGKVHLDCNGNGVQDQGEIGVPGVRLYLEDGTFVVTDAEGKYSLYGLSPRTHVLKLDRTSLPGGASLGVASNRNAGDAGSRFVDLKNGELHKADFIVDTCAPGVLEAIRLRRIRAAGDELNVNLRSPLSADGKSTFQGDARALPASGIVSGNVAPADGTPGARAAAEQAKSGEPDHAALDLEQRAAALDNELGFVDLKQRDVLPVAQTNVRVKGLARALIELKINGEPVPETRIGKRIVIEDRRLEVREYIGVDLNPGENTITVTQRDDFGNERASRSIAVLAPGRLARVAVEIPQPAAAADGTSEVRIRIRLEDERGLPVTARTPLTLETTLGRWQAEDLDKKEPGVQVFVDGGAAEFVLQSPPEPGESPIRVSSGMLKTEAKVSFLPPLRPLLAAGVVEGVLNLRKLSPNALVPARSQDGFEKELQHLSWSSADGRRQAGARAALFLKGKIKGDYLLTLGYDSDKDSRERLFRDIQPDRFYPVYGDSAVKGFDAQSTSRLYVRVDKDRSYLLYGDFTTQSSSPARSLGAYGRSLSGVKEHYEAGGKTLNAFASRDSTRQIVEELPANGTSGPFTLSNSNAIANSEKVEIVTRDRNQPALILKSTPQARFSDYEIEPFTGRILFRAPVPSVDAYLNPTFIRVTYEVDQGGAEFWVAGLDGQVKLSDRIEIGGSLVADRNPQDPAQLKSVNVTAKLSDRTTLVAEVAHTSKLSAGSGSGERIELQHEGAQLRARLYAGKTDPAFDNPAAALSKGRSESGAKASYHINERTRLVGEAIRTEDVATGNGRAGVQLGAERSFDGNVRLEAGVRHARESVVATRAANTTAPADTTSYRAKLSAPLPAYPQATVYGEAEQDVADSSKRLAALGGEYQFANRGRLYARHEFISSLNGPYALNPTQRQNTTVLGLDSDYMKDGRAFSEYRARDAISGREAQAAIGLRNLWNVAEGVRINTSFERVRALSGSAQNEATALTGAVEYTRNPLWKGTARLELRMSPGSDSVLNTLGLAYKVTRDWSFLGRNILSITDNKTPGAENRIQERLQLGMAYRETDLNMWNGLARYEYKLEQDGGDASLAVKRWVHILSTHASYQPRRSLLVTARYAGKIAVENSNALSSNSRAHLVSGRVTHDINSRWDVGIAASTLFSGGFRSQQYGLGPEVGYLLKDNLWVSAGYNFVGFKDRDLSGEDYTRRGVYIRLRFKFDENLFAENRTGS